MSLRLRLKLVLLLILSEDLILIKILLELIWSWLVLIKNILGLSLRDLLIEKILGLAWLGLKVKICSLILALILLINI